MLDGVAEISEEAFSNCKGLNNVYCCAEEVPTTDFKAFADANIATATLHVPAKAVANYETTYPWSDFGTIVAMSDEEVTAITSVQSTKTDIKDIYDLNGRQQSKTQRGVNIIRFNNGTTKKVMVK